MEELFHSLLLVTSTARGVFFGLLAGIGENQFPGGAPLNTFLNIIPDALFFSTFCLLVMFWANIFHTAHNRPPEFVKRVRRGLKSANVVVYLVQITFWVLLNFVAKTQSELNTIVILFHVQVVLLCVLTTFGFILYGGSLYFLLRRFPINSIGQRRRLLREVGWVTTICCASFPIRAIWVLLFIARSSYHEVSFVVCGSYFFVVEVVPSALVLWILRRMPSPKTVPGNLYHRVIGAVGYERFGDNADSAESFIEADGRPPNVASAYVTPPAISYHDAPPT